MKEQDRKAYNNGRSDTMKVLSESDDSTATTAKLHQMLTDANARGKATFYHHGVKDALEAFQTQQKMAATAA